MVAALQQVNVLRLAGGGAWNTMPVAPINHGHAHIPVAPIDLGHEHIPSYAPESAVITTSTASNKVDGCSSGRGAAGKKLLEDDRMILETPKSMDMTVLEDERQGRHHSAGQTRGRHEDLGMFSVCFLLCNAIVM
jgi:hypothetical protein